jgi:hypothetical protein
MWQIFFLMLSSSIEINQKICLPYFLNPTSNTKVLSGYLDVDGSTLALCYYPSGAFPNTIVHKQSLAVTKPDHKMLLEKAIRQDSAVKIVGKIVEIQGKQFFLIDSVVILDLILN